MGFSGPKNGRDTPSKNQAKLLIVDGGKIRNAGVNRLILRVGALSNVQSVAVISIDLRSKCCRQFTTGVAMATASNKCGSVASSSSNQVAPTGGEGTKHSSQVEAKERQYSVGVRVRTCCCQLLHKAFRLETCCYASVMISYRFHQTGNAFQQHLSSFGEEFVCKIYLLLFATDWNASFALHFKSDSISTQRQFQTLADWIPSDQNRQVDPQRTKYKEREKIGFVHQALQWLRPFALVFMNLKVSSGGLRFINIPVWMMPEMHGIGRRWQRLFPRPNGSIL